MINISINNNSDSNNYPRLDLDAGQETIQIKLHLRKMCVFGAGNVFKEEEKLMLWKNISPSSGNNCSFPFWGSCKRKECPSRIALELSLLLFSCSDWKKKKEPPVFEMGILCFFPNFIWIHSHLCSIVSVVIKLNFHLSNFCSTGLCTKRKLDLLVSRVH